MDDGRLRGCACVALLLTEQYIIGMIEAGPAIGPFAERGKRRFRIMDASPRNSAEFFFRYGVADAD